MMCEGKGTSSRDFCGQITLGSIPEGTSPINAQYTQACWTLKRSLVMEFIQLFNALFRKLMRPQNPRFVQTIESWPY